MNRKIEKYSIVWNIDANEGQLILQLAKSKEGGGTASLLLASPAEGTLVLDILRNEKPVYFDDDNNLILTGFGSLDVKKKKKTATKNKAKK